MTNPPDFFDLARARVDYTLQNKLKSMAAVPPLLRDAMNYAVSQGGKRLRPLLVYATGHCFDQSLDVLDPIAAAVECIHAYSLIHDDLPAMDDDTLRRGKPTCHIVFGEALAILAGDALQALAFELITDISSALLSAEVKLQMIKVLARHTGAEGMVGGQALDILAENKSLTATDIEKIHHLKTGALIRACVQLAALAANCSESVVAQLDLFATQLGLAFQLQDDLQDQLGHSQKTGKNSGQDAKHHKSTYALSEGIAATEARIGNALTEIKNSLDRLENTAMLKTLCDRMINVKCF